MIKTLEIDDDLLAKARLATRADTDDAIVGLALQALLSSPAYVHKLSRLEPNAIVTVGVSENGGVPAALQALRDRAGREHVPSVRPLSNDIPKRSDEEPTALRHADFHIGLEFMMSDARWRCTDIGKRTIIAIKLDLDDPSWYNGPPYAVVEHVIDEYDLPACESIAGDG